MLTFTYLEDGNVYIFNFSLGNFTKRLAIDLLQQVRNPHNNVQRSDSLCETDDELAIDGVPQRIASKRNKSEVFCKLDFCRLDFSLVKSNQTKMFELAANDSPLEPTPAGWSRNGGAHYDVASAWMDNDAASEELHRYD